MNSNIFNRYFYIKDAILVAFLLTTYSTHLDANIKEEKKSFYLYFNNYKITKNSSCALVYPLKRSIDKSSFSVESVLKNLFMGPSKKEKKLGYSSYFSKKTSNILKHIYLDKENFTAYINLKDIRSILPDITSSCGSTEFISQITETLKQFPNIDRIIFAINGNAKLFYQWINTSCNKYNNYCKFKSYIPK
jgi:spore germination protein GerM